MTISLVDSHCHIPLIEQAGGEQAIIDTAKQNKVEHMLCVSIDLETFPDVLQLAEQNKNISASVGVHPNSKIDIEPTAEQLVALASNSHVIAIGETGLDYYRSQGELGWQRNRFRVHIKAAKLAGKPLIIHSRNTKEDVIKILTEEGADEVGGVMHCFVDDWETAQRAIELNFYISFSGIVTFKNAQDLKAVARQVPLEKMLVETDSPYLAPVPFRGKQNQPAYVRHVAEHIAELRDMPYEAVAQATTDNFFKLFPSH